MKFTPLKLTGAFKIDLEKRLDERGFFARQFCQAEFKKVNLNTQWEQMNISQSINKGTIRGLHFQRPPMAEIKMVRCIKGAVFDVMVDLRKQSSTFGEWYGEELTAVNRSMFYIPQGFAHGFQTLVDDTELLYWHSQSYSSEHEGGLNLLDRHLSIKWPCDISGISDRDKNFPALSELEPIAL